MRTDTGRRATLKALTLGAAAFAAGTGRVSASPHENPHMSPHAGPDTTAMTDQPAHHGSIVLGTETLYMVHIADTSPHDYQAIFEVSFDAESKANFLEDRRRNPRHVTYTINPESFVLPEMAREPRPFRASLHRGNFTNDKGGVLVREDVRIDVKRVVYFKKFDPAEPLPSTSRFLMFGDRHGHYACHYLTAKPDFDQVVEIGIDDAWLRHGDEATAAGAEAGAACRLVTVNAEQNVPLGVSGNVVGARAPDGRTTRVTLYRQLYFELDYIDKYYDLTRAKG